MKQGRVDIGGGLSALAVSIAADTFGRSPSHGGELRVFLPRGADPVSAREAVELWCRRGYSPTLWKQVEIDAQSSPTPSEGGLSHELA